MKITFLLGNGLDLNCGCKSAYKDIYDYYKRQLSESKWIGKLKGDISTWGDFEMEMARYASNFENEQMAIECIRDFKRQMDKYLLSENNRMIKYIYEGKGKGYVNPRLAYIIQKSITEFHLNCIPNVSNEISKKIYHNPIYYNFVSFNYTSFLDPLLFSVAKRVTNDINKSISKDMYCEDPEIIHIHGTLNGNEILGIDNINQFGELKYSHSSLDMMFIKPLLNENVDLQRISNASDAIKQADIICVFGMSLGDSDLTWRKVLLDWLQSDKQHHLVMYDYSQFNTENYLIDQKIEAEYSAKEKFLTKCNIQIQGIEKQIHIPIGANIFNIKDEIEKQKQLATEKNEPDKSEAVFA